MLLQGIKHQIEVNQDQYSFTIDHNSYTRDQILYIENKEATPKNRCYLLIITDDYTLYLIEHIYGMYYSSNEVTNHIYHAIKPDQPCIQYFQFSYYYGGCKYISDEGVVFVVIENDQITIAKNDESYQTKFTDLLDFDFTIEKNYQMNPIVYPISNHGFFYSESVKEKIGGILKIKSSKAGCISIYDENINQLYTILMKQCEITNMNENIQITGNI